MGCLTFWQVKRRNSGRMTVSEKTPGVASVSSGATELGQAASAQEVPVREKSIRDADFIKRGLEQMAASREKNRRYFKAVSGINKKDAFSISQGKCVLFCGAFQRFYRYSGTSGNIYSSMTSISR